MTRLEGHGLESPASRYEFKPYPSDRLSCRHGFLVEFETPAHTSGLGSAGSLGESDLAAFGFVNYRETDEVLHLLVVRLPPALAELRSAIVRHQESAASR